MKSWFKLLIEKLAFFFSLIIKGKYVKAANYLLTLYSMVTRPDVVKNYPTILVFEPGNVCNLRCALCATGQRDPTRSRQMLAFADYKKILDQVGKYAIKVDLYNWGEPFINKHIFDMITYAKKFSLHVELSSNLNFYTRKMGKKIIESGLDRLICSIHGGSSQTYSKYMLGGNFEKTITNLKHLIKLRNLHKLKKPIIRWRFVVFRHNEHEVEKTEKFSQQLGVDEFEPLPMKMSVGFDIPTIKKNIWKQRDWIPTRSEYNLYDIHKRQLKNKHQDCFWPWEIISIGADGGVQPCCVFYNQKFDFGNVFKKPFWSVWNNQYYQLSRRVLRLKIRNDTQTICSRCLASSFLAK